MTVIIRHRHHPSGMHILHAHCDVILECHTVRVPLDPVYVSPPLQHPLVYMTLTSSMSIDGQYSTYSRPCPPSSISITTDRQRHDYMHNLNNLKKNTDVDLAPPLLAFLDPHDGREVRRQEPQASDPDRSPSPGTISPSIRRRRTPNPDMRSPNSILSWGILCTHSPHPPETPERVLCFDVDVTSLDLFLSFFFFYVSIRCLVAPLRECQYWCVSRGRRGGHAATGTGRLVRDRLPPIEPKAVWLGGGSCLSLVLLVGCNFKLQPVLVSSRLSGPSAN